MREIIFKGKNKRSGKWVEGNLIVKHKESKNIQNLDDDNKIILETKYSIQYINKNGKYSTCEVYEKTIGQYTGFKDKGNNKIFENDIVYVEGEDDIAKIIWDEETARFIVQFNGWCADFDNYYGKELEIICNNPELLDKE